MNFAQMSLYFSLLFLGLPHSLWGQVTDAWAILADTEFSEKYFEEEGTSFLSPTFGPLVQAQEGKRFTITGFLIPLDPANNEYMLSKYPYASCFFCGAAGPESVLELQFQEITDRQRNYNIDDYLSFEGILRLNSTDIFRMNYILEDAKEIEN